MSLKNFLLSLKYKRRLKKLTKRKSEFSKKELFIGILECLVTALLIAGFIFGMKTGNAIIVLYISLFGLGSIILFTLLKNY